MKKIKLSTKLLVAFLLVGAIPASVIGLLSLNKSSNTLEEQSYNQLLGMRDVKKAQIEQFFAERQGDMGVLVETVGTLREEAFAKLQAVRQIKKGQIEGYFKQRLDLMEDVKKSLRFTGGLPAFIDVFAQGTDSEAYKEVYDARYDGFKTIMDVFGFYDIFLIDSKGDVVFTVCKESDFGQNVLTGELKNSGLGELFQSAQQNVAVTDFSWYDPSNEPASVLGTPLRDPNGQFIGIAVDKFSG